MMQYLSKETKKKEDIKIKKNLTREEKLKRGGMINKCLFLRVLLYVSKMMVF